MRALKVRRNPGKTSFRARIAKADERREGGTHFKKGINTLMKLVPSFEEERDINTHNASDATTVDEGYFGPCICIHHITPKASNLKFYAIVLR